MYLCDIPNYIMDRFLDVVAHSYTLHFYTVMKCNVIYTVHMHGFWVHVLSEMIAHTSITIPNIHTNTY